MINAILNDTSFTLSKLHGSDLSGASLNYADISLTDTNDITLDDRTDTKDINLLSKGFYFEWEDVRDNKELIDIIMNKFDSKNFDSKLKNKILLDNPDYS